MIDYKKISTPVPGELDEILASCRAARMQRERQQVLPIPRKELFAFGTDGLSRRLDQKDFEREIDEYGGVWQARRDGLVE